MQPAAAAAAAATSAAVAVTVRRQPVGDDNVDEQDVGRAVSGDRVHLRGIWGDALTPPALQVLYNYLIFMLLFDF